MFWRKKPTVDADEMALQLEHWTWLDGLLGPVDGDPPRFPVFPSRKVFPETTAKGHARARHYFDRVRDIYAIPDGTCELVPQKVRPKLGDSIVFGEIGSSHALGTYQPRDNVARITYDPGQLDDPLQLIATFAHELAHLKLEYRTVPPPGGEDTMEPLTDLTTVHMGFGLFGANRAFNYSQSTSYDRQGWNVNYSGYLSEAEWGFSNAILFELLDVPENDYADYAKPSVFSLIARNRAFLRANRDIVDRLRTGSRTSS
jgi:hypothetical protein